ncbi:hypothetical protein PAAG_11430 [Paracoccidioides lutzii Pb01]|uniref:Uncharacterized protein n=1 Tax=Paracoccidioides lutzii (strain ATCC MYA-826 / Pb01) TaxID=502779 RepID=A0A0A2VLW7_PARBA|nr:hypothetical protein PAAG_11430 [Paracoccidioides lutzii Pb01]KGQ01854.1 hypothetical protein PAAG_11430 [Paracoccidioides lutzii Pb01]
MFLKLERPDDASWQLKTRHPRHEVAVAWNLSGFHVIIAYNFTNVGKDTEQDGWPLGAGILASGPNCHAIPVRRLFRKGNGDQTGSAGDTAQWQEETNRQRRDSMRVRAVLV